MDPSGELELKGTGVKVLFWILSKKYGTLITEDPKRDSDLENYPCVCLSVCVCVFVFVFVCWLSFSGLEARMP